MQQPAVNVMVKAERAGGNVLLRNMHKLDALNVVEKERMDAASEVDGLAEDAIIKALRPANPHSSILRAARGAQTGTPSPSRHTWTTPPHPATPTNLPRSPHCRPSLPLSARHHPHTHMIIPPLPPE